MYKLYVCIYIFKLRESGTLTLYLSKQREHPRRVKEAQTTITLHMFSRGQIDFVYVILDKEDD